MVGQAELDYIEETFTPLVLKCKQVPALAAFAARSRLWCRRAWGLVTGVG